MCNGIAVLVYEKEGELKGLCTGITSHDELCKLDEDLRYGKIEPYRFELLYPCNLVYDRGHNKTTELGIFKEQPKKEIWEIAFEVSSAYRMMHTIQQLMWASLGGVDLRGVDLRGANMTGANLTRANLRGVDLRGVDLRGANLTGVDLRGVDLRGANMTGTNLTGVDLRGAYYNANTYGLSDKQKETMIDSRR